MTDDTRLSHDEAFSVAITTKKFAPSFVSWFEAQLPALLESKKDPEQKNKITQELELIKKDETEREKTVAEWLINRREDDPTMYSLLTQLAEHMNSLDQQVGKEKASALCADLTARKQTLVEEKQWPTANARSIASLDMAVTGWAINDLSQLTAYRTLPQTTWGTLYNIMFAQI